MYTQRVDRATPSCLIFMVDQSASMYDPMAGTDTPKSVVVAEQLNATVMELIQRCSKSHTEPPRPYFAVAVIGYRTDQAGNAIIESCIDVPGQEGDLAWTTDLAQQPLRIEQRTRQTSDGPLTYRMPIWVEPLNEGGTPMCAAMDRAGRIAHAWIQTYPQSFPPIIINLTDGESTDGDAGTWADRLRQLASEDGPLLLFNIMLATGSELSPAMFPNDADQLPDSFARDLFSMSSELPEFMRSAAVRQGYRAEPGARGMSMNADFRAVVSFLNIGTSVGHLLR
ncbi:MAG: VWA domain-containing protein [Ilumatobacter sp.]